MTENPDGSVRTVERKIAFGEETMPRIDTCKGCGKPIMWRYTEKGKAMPLDPDPVKEPLPGTYVTNDRNCRPASPLLDDGPYFMNHFATCPHREDFKHDDGKRKAV